MEKAEPNESVFLRLLVASQRRILSYLVTLLFSVEDAEEILQETTMVMWDKFEEFLSTQTGEPDIDRFVAWGNQIAFYKVLNARRKSKTNQHALGDEVIHLISREWMREEESNVLEMRRLALSRCLEELPKVRRDVLRDYYWQKSSVKQIAEKHNRSVDGIYKLLQRARAALHSCIDRRLAQEQSNA